MKGKIFKVIGIVLGVIVAFVGVVVGVMAIQGKFKKPVVYPNELIFETNNFVVVNDDSLDDVHLHSFTLTGRNGDKAVNRKTCYIKFVDYLNDESIYGDELITLCNANKEPLPVTENGYQVNCNEPIYYTFKPMGSNPIHYSRQNFGKVVLEAYSENGLVKSNQLVFYVDKAVEQIRFTTAENYTTKIDNFTHKIYGSQILTMLLGNELELDYNLLPYYSAKPYSENSVNKNAELYYFNPSVTDDYLLINSAFLEGLEQNENLYNLKNFIKVENGKVYPQAAGSFIYAVFDSYEAQQNCPTTEFLRDHVQNYMVYTVLDLEVISETAETVDLENNSRISLNLYENNTLYLNSSTPSASEKTLSLKINGNETSKLFDILEFNINQNRFWSNNLTFASENNSLNLKNGEEVNYRITNNNLVVDGTTYTIIYCTPEINIDGFKVVEKLTFDGEDYVCQNGVALSNGNSFKLLRSGGFLEFFIYDENNNTYTMSNMGYEAAKVAGTSGANTSFNLLIKSNPQLEQNSSLQLMVLMSGSNGKLVYDSVNAYILTNQFVLDGENVQQNVELNISYSNNVANFDQVNFANIVTLNGTYSAGVLVTPKNDNGYSIEVIPEITYTYNDQTYVLVGTKGENGEFINVVKAKDRVGNSTTSVYLLLLKNAYEQTAENFVNGKLSAGTAIAESEVAAIYLDTTITIQNNYELADNLTYNFNESQSYEANENDKDNYIIFKNNCYHILEHTTNHTLTISSPNAQMLANIFDKISKEDFACYIVGDRCQDAITILGISLDDDGNLLVNFSANGYSVLNGENFVLGLTYNGSNYYSPSLCIDDCDPEQITFALNDLTTNLPTDSSADAPTIDVQITGIDQDGNFTFSYSYNDKSIDNINNIFNSTYNKGAEVNFIPSPAYSSDFMQYNFEYTSLDESILKITQTDGTYKVDVLKIGQCKVLVTLESRVSLGENSINEITELVGYINFNITTDESAFTFELKNENSQINSTENEIKLKAYLTYKYNEEELTDAKYFTISKLSCNNSNYRLDGELKIVDKFGAAVVTISNDDVKGWEITRSEAYTYANINLSFEVNVATSSKTIKVEIYFSNAITIDLNSAYDATIYENTNVQLMEKVGKNEDFKTNSLIRIKELESISNTYTIKYKQGEEGVETPTSDNKINLKSGVYTFNIYSSSESEKLLASYNVQVLPNVVFSANSSQLAKLQALESDSEYTLNNYLTIKQYKTDKTYGESTDAVYTDIDLVPFENYKDLNFVTDETDSNKYENILSFVDLDKVENLDEVKFSTLWLTDLDEQVDQIVKIVYGTTSFDLPVKITNKYAKLAKYSDAPFLINARVETSAPISFDGESWVLNSVTADGYEFIVDDGQFKLNQDISEKVNAVLTFEFVHDGGVDSGKKLTYTNANNLNGNAQNLTIVLTPYLPEPKSEVKAYSATSFDIIGDIFDIGTASGITSITIEKSANAEFYNYITETNEIVYNFTNPANTTINFKEINGDTKDITITYHIEYENSDVSYNHEYVLTIFNRQIIEPKYPYAGYGEGTEVKGFNVINNDADTYNFLQKHLTMTAYEIVNVGQTITFGDNSRVKISNRADSEKLTNQIKSVELAAYMGNISNLAQISKTEQNTFEVEFTAATSAYMLFKITTNSNNFDFYFVRLYNQNLNNNYKDINSTNSWEFSLQADGEKFYSTNKILNQDFTKTLLQDKFNLQNVTPTAKNFSLYLLEASLLGGTANAYDTLKLTQFSLLNNETLSALTQFATLKIALIYIGTNDNAEIYLGNIIVYSQSSATITNNNDNVTDLITGMQNGEYSATWDSTWDKNFTNPFSVGSATPTLTFSWVSAGFKIENGSIYLQNDEQNQPIVSIFESSITREKYLTIDLSFVVEYAYEIDGETLYLYIHFTMPAVNPPTERYTTEIKYNTRSQEFENSVTIDLNGYKGRLQIGENELDSADESITIGNATITYLDGMLTVECKLLPNAYRVEFKIMYLDIANADLSREISIVVDSAVYIDFPTTSPGSSGEPLEAKKTAEGDAIYQREDASNIEITKEGNTYSVGGLKIITNENAELELTFNTNTNFVVTQLTDNVLNVSGEQIINFAHNAKTDNVIVEIAIKIKHSSGYYTNLNDDDIVTRFYVKVPRTYAGLVATYLIDGATHENVSSGTTIENIRNNLFKKSENAGTNDKDILNYNTYNASKIAIIGLDGGQPIFSNTGFAAMGFINKSNANYINISIDSGLINNLIPNDSDDNLTFQNVSSNLLTNIVLSNNAGVQNVNYNYQLLAEFKLNDNETAKFIDGIIAQDEYLSKTSNNGNVQKVDFSFVINKKDDLSTSFSTDELTIAKLLDSRNNEIFIKSINKTDTTDTYTLIPTQSSRTENAGIISYFLTFGSKYTLELIRTADMFIKIKLTDLQKTNTDEQLNFDFTLVGNGGEINLTLNFYNCTIEDIDGQKVTAGSSTTINLKEKVTSNSSGSALSAVKFEYQRDGSYFKYKNQTYTNLSESNEYFTLTNGDGVVTIKVETITSNADIYLIFKVMLDGKQIGFIHVSITAECKYEFKINGSQTITGSTATQNDVYYLWLQNPSSEKGNFKTIKLFDYKDSTSTYAIYHSGGVDYNSGINISLFNGEKQLDADSVTITAVDQNDKPVEPSHYSIEKTSDNIINLIFKKDFSGTIILKLSATTVNGDFVRYISLNVLGYIKLEYVNGRTQNSYIYPSNGSFNSNTPVQLINSYEGAKNIGLVISTTQQESKYEGVTTSVQYAIIEHPNKKLDDVAQTFASANPSDINLTPDTSSGFSLSTDLPIVPMSGRNYVVMYKITLTYLEQTTDDYYLLYVVHNDISVTANTTQINVDNDLDSGSTLRLFRYYITYTANGSEYVVYYGNKDNSGNKLYLVDKQKNTTYNGTAEGDKLTFTNAGSTITFESASSDTPTITIDSKPYSATRKIEYAKEQNGKYVAYNLSYKSIVDFKNLIDELYVRIDADKNSGYVSATDTTTNLYYQLTYLSKNNGTDYGVYGINLTAPYSSHDFNSQITLQNNKFFNNEFNGTINLMSNKSHDVILASSLNLMSNNTLSANGYTLNDIFGLNLGDENNYSIIGVGSSPVTNWVNSATTVEQKSNPTVTQIEYLGKTYEVCNATWKANSSGIYNLSKEFYYIKADELITVNYSSGDANSFIVSIEYFKESVFSANNKLLQYGNSNGGLTRTSLSATLSDVSLIDEDSSQSDKTSDYVTQNDSNITVAWANLVKYKNLHPDKNFLTVTCKLTYSNIQLEITINFKLPDNETISVENLTNDAGSETKDLELTNSSANYHLTIPTSSEGKINYVELTSTEIKTASLVESGTHYSTISISNETSTTIKISLNVDIIKAYFASNNAKFLTVNYVLTINGQSVNIDVCVKNPNL